MINCAQSYYFEAVKELMAVSDGDAEKGGEKVEEVQVMTKLSDLKLMAVSDCDDSGQKVEEEQVMTKLSDLKVLDLP